MLTVITGPMFAGKSSKLISMAVAHVIAGHNVLAFKPANDNRYGGGYITTHSDEKFMATSIDPDDPHGIINHVLHAEMTWGRKIDVVIVDEAQFFNSKSLIPTVEDLLYNDGKTIILSGLSQDSSGKPFGAMPHFLATADDIIHLKAVCAKSKKIGAATRTFRKDVNNTNQVAVGGSEMYEPRSFDEWLKESRRIT
jgi:thymidine kinase